MAHADAAAKINRPSLEDVLRRIENGRGLIKVRLSAHASSRLCGYGDMGGRLSLVSKDAGLSSKGFLTG